MKIHYHRSEIDFVKVFEDYVSDINEQVSILEVF